LEEGKSPFCQNELSTITTATATITAAIVDKATIQESPSQQQLFDIAV